MTVAIPLLAVSVLSFSPGAPDQLAIVRAQYPDSPHPHRTEAVLRAALHLLVPYASSSHGDCASEAKRAEASPEMNHSTQRLKKPRRHTLRTRGARKESHAASAKASTSLNGPTEAQVDSAGSYAFVVTDEHGNRVYGCCAHVPEGVVLPAGPEGSFSVHAESFSGSLASGCENASSSRTSAFPELCAGQSGKLAGVEGLLVCILSGVPYSRFLSDTLATVFSDVRRENASHSDAAVLSSWGTISYVSSNSLSSLSASLKVRAIASSTGNTELLHPPLPPAAASSRPVLGGSDLVCEKGIKQVLSKTVQLVRASEFSQEGFRTSTDRPCTDIPLLLCSLPPRCISTLLAALMEERRVVLTSHNISKLSRCVLALSLLLKPLVWPHTLIPLLPEKLVDILCAPTPYIIGLPDRLSEKVKFAELDEVIFADVDSGIYWYKGESCSHEDEEGANLESLDHRVPRRPRNKLERRLAKLQATDCKYWTEQMTGAVTRAIEHFYEQILQRSTLQRKEVEDPMLTSRVFQKRGDDPCKRFVGLFCQSQMLMTWRAGQYPQKNENFEYLQCRHSEFADTEWDIHEEISSWRGDLRIDLRNGLRTGTRSLSMDYSKELEDLQEAHTGSDSSSSPFLERKRNRTGFQKTRRRKGGSDGAHGRNIVDDCNSFRCDARFVSFGGVCERDSRKESDDFSLSASWKQRRPWSSTERIYSPKVWKRRSVMRTEVCYASAKDQLRRSARVEYVKTEKAVQRLRNRRPQAEACNTGGSPREKCRNLLNMVAYKLAMAITLSPVAS